MDTDFGPYELRHRIGNGGMAWVWQGVQKELDLPVAIKVLYPQFAEDEKFVERFLSGARAAARLQHPNIVRVMFFGRHEAGPFIVMEFVDGSDLRRWMERNPAPPLEVALVMLRDVARAIETAHGHNIVHRDLKPANIMFGRDGTVKLMDFDLARRLDDPMHLTQTGTALGTVPYMSPEQADGRAVGKESDLFSFGVICYELLCGVRPFPGQSESEVRRAREHDPRPLEGANPIAPPRIVAIVRSMLVRDIARRCRSAADVRREFDVAVSDLGLLDEAGLMAAYAAEPDRLLSELAQRRRDRHLKRAQSLDARGPTAEEEALREYGLALHIDPSHTDARTAVRRLSDSITRRVERAKRAVGSTEPTEREGPSDPDDVDRTWVYAPSATPAAAKRPAATPEPVPSDAAPPARDTTETPPQSNIAPEPPPHEAIEMPLQSNAAPEPVDAPEAAFVDVSDAPPGPPPPPASSSRKPLVLGLAAAATVLLVILAVVLSRPRLEPEPVPDPAPAVAPIVPPSAPVLPDTAAIAAVVPLPPTVGRLVVETVPTGTQVRLDGGRPRFTPAVFDSIAPGEHRIVVRRDSFETSTRRLATGAGTDTAIRIVLRRRAPGLAKGVALRVDVNPADASVRLDAGEPQRSPARFDGLRRGTVALLVAREGFVSQRMIVPISGLRDTAVTFRLVTPPRPLEVPQRSASLRIKTSPSGAKLKLDDRVEQGASYTFRDVTQGQHILTVSKDGYRTQHLVLAFSALRDSAFTVPLERVP